MQMPRSRATSLGSRPYSVTIRIAPALNASSYRGGGVPFFFVFSSMVLAPFLSILRLAFLSVNSGMGAFLPSWFILCIRIKSRSTNALVLRQLADVLHRSPFSFASPDHSGFANSIAEIVRNDVCMCRCRRSHTGPAPAAWPRTAACRFPHRLHPDRPDKHSSRRRCCR